MSFTITPPLFQVSLSPGENWASTIKVVNNNPYSMEVYASPMNFESSGELGTGNFIPIIGEEKATSSSSLASWFELPKKSFYIGPEKTVSIPFSMHVPKNAEPGGHYGAILIGNQPPSVKEGNALHVASLISSLFLVRIAGDIVEIGDIREFSTNKTFYQEPRATLSIRFENKGNVHIQPQGEIDIYNMWGKNRGKIMVNDGVNFGNVLPKSIRKFSYEWTGESSFFDIGRYKAVATLTFGEQARHNVNSVLYFWIIPVVPLLKIFGFIIVFISFLTFSIKRYIKRAIAFEEERIAELYGVRPNAPAQKSKEAPEKSQIAKSIPLSTPKPSVVIMTRPIIKSAVDLRRAVSASKVSPSQNQKERVEEKFTLWQFVSEYKLLLVSLVVLFAGIYAVKMYFTDVLISARNYRVEIKREDGRSAPVSSDSRLREGDIVFPERQ